MPPKNKRTFQSLSPLPTHLFSKSLQLLGHVTFPIFLMKKPLSASGKLDESDTDSYHFTTGSFCSPNGVGLGLIVTDPRSGLTYVHEFDESYHYQRHDGVGEDIGAGEMFNIVISALMGIGFYTRKLFNNASVVLQYPLLIGSTPISPNTTRKSTKRSKSNRGDAVLAPAAGINQESKETVFYPLITLTLLYIQMSPLQRMEWLQSQPFSLESEAQHTFNRLLEIFGEFISAFSFSLEPILDDGGDANALTNNLPAHHSHYNPTISSHKDFNDRPVSLCKGGFAENEDTDDFTDDFDDCGDKESDQIVVAHQRSSLIQSPSHTRALQKQQLIITTTLPRDNTKKGNDFTTRHAIPLQLLKPTIHPTEQCTTFFGLPAPQICHPVHNSLITQPAFDSTVFFYERMESQWKLEQKQRELDQSLELANQQNSVLEQRLTQYIARLESLNDHALCLTKDLEDCRKLNQQFRDGAIGFNHLNDVNNHNQNNITNIDIEDHDDNHSLYPQRAQPLSQLTQPTPFLCGTRQKNIKKHGGFLSEPQKRVLEQKNRFKRTTAKNHDASSSSSDEAF